MLVEPVAVFKTTPILSCSVVILTILKLIIKMLEILTQPVLPNNA